MSRSEITEAVGILDKAARKSDRWWFIVLLIVGMAWAGFTQYEMRQALSVRDARINEIEHQYIAHLQEWGSKSAQMIAENTQALNDVRRAMERQDVPRVTTRGQ